MLKTSLNSFFLKKLFWQRNVIAAALGMLSVLAFAPFNMGVLALFTLAGLFFLWKKSISAKESASAGFFFGLGLMGVGVFWLRNSIGQFGGLTPELAIVVTLLFSMVLALYFSLAGWLSFRCRTTQKTFIFYLIVAPASWVLAEWFRGTFLGGFPWLSFSYSQLDLPLSGYIPLVGSLGVSFLLGLSAGLLLMWKKVWPLFVFLLIWVTGSALSWQSWGEAIGEPIQVSLLQANIAQKDKWRSTMLEPTLNWYREQTDAVPESQLVIWPETAVPAFDDRVRDSFLTPLHHHLVEQQRDVITGIVVRNEDGSYQNAMVSLGVSGQDRYGKRHLVPFGEFLPLKAWLKPMFSFLQIPMSDFSPGNNEPPIIHLAGYPVGINICYEDAFANEILRAMPIANFLINASNDAWFGDSLAPQQHLQIARMRALETSRYLLRATNTGISAIIDHRGSVRASTLNFTEAVLSAKIQPRKGTTPYAKIGDWPIISFLVILLVAAFYVGWKHRQARIF